MPLSLARLVVAAQGLAGWSYQQANHALPFGWPDVPLQFAVCWSCHDQFADLPLVSHTAPYTGNAVHFIQNYALQVHDAVLKVLRGLLGRPRS